MDGVHTPSTAFLHIREGHLTLVTMFFHNNLLETIKDIG